MLLFVVRLSAGASPEMGLPIACTPSVDCWVVNYVDVDPASGSAADFRCGTRTYDNHKGTDFAVRDWAVMTRGVDVVAVADGTVIRTRDGMKDREPSADGLRRLLKSKRACGNGVLMEHKNGWRTMYCHLKENSIVVARNERVRGGQKLGEVGHTGYAQFPHVHLTVYSGNDVVDPFTGRSSKAGCGGAPTSLWAQNLGLAYEPVSLYAAGFTGKKPDFRAIRQDASSPESLLTNAEALTFWVALYGVRKDDRIFMEIRDPDDRPFARRETLQDRDRARQYYFVGKSNKRGALPTGAYSGSAVLIRSLEDGTRIVREITRQIVIK